VTRLLHIAASPKGADSESRAIAETFVEAYLDAHEDGTADTFDLWKEPLPAFDAAAVAAQKAVLAGRPLEGAAHTAWQAVRRTFERFDSYDRYVFSVPMWNSGIPYVLKHFIDVVSQSGMLFRLDRTSGYTGLLQGKKAVAIYTSGVYAPGMPEGFGSDLQSTTFNDWLRWAGITEIDDISVRALRFAADPDTLRREAHARARELGKTF
jgi:FMN-dependent NADH-azoreductase